MTDKETYVKVVEARLTEMHADLKRLIARSELLSGEQGTKFIDSLKEVTESFNDAVGKFRALKDGDGPAPDDAIEAALTEISASLSELHDRL